MIARPGRGGQVGPDMTGQRFGKLRVLRRSPKRTDPPRAFFVCKCDCGTFVERPGANLRRIVKLGGEPMCQRCRVVKAAALSTGPRRDPYEQT